MKRRFPGSAALAVLISLVFLITAEAQRFVPAEAADVSVMGRVALTPEGMRMGFPGVSLRFVYRGAAPSVKFRAETDGCYFDVSLDEASPLVMHLEKGENLVELPFGESDADGFVVEIVRRTESWMGEAVFEGIALPEGCELLAAPVLPMRKMMFIGDSTTCGEFNERFPPREEISPRTTNATRSYGMLVAEAFGAQVHLIAYGGQGIVRDWSGASEGEAVCLAPEYFELAAPGNKTVRWNHGNYVPDVIAINLGTDFDAGLFDQEAYNEIYYGFVKQVRSAYPLSQIVLCESNFLSDEPGTETFEAREVLRLTLETVVAKSLMAGDRRVRMVRLPYYSGTEKDPHLTVQQHEALAAELVPQIREIMDWR